MLEWDIIGRMLNQHSLQTIQTLGFSQQFVRPGYGSYCFAHIPDTIRQLFGLPAAQPLPTAALPATEGYQNVVFFFMDAFGWRFLEEYAQDHPLLQEFMANGLVSQMTSMFPSTTAAHTACIHSGLDVASSGVHEWFYYEPVVDDIIAPLLFSLATQKEREQLVSLGFQASQFIPPTRLYPDLEAAGVQTHVFNHYEYAFSSFSGQVCQGAATHAYVSLPEALTNLHLLLEKQKGKRTYAFMYYPSFDSILHRYGPGSPQARAEMMSWLNQLEYFLHQLKNLPRTLLLFSADHGQSETNPATTIYLNREIPGLKSALKTNRRGEPLLFGGSPRDLFLYVQEFRLNEIQNKISEVMRGRGEVYQTAELCRQGIFGPASASPALQERVGNLVVLPYRGESVFWYEKGMFEQKYYGHHGGLSPEDMLIPLIAYPVG